MIHKDGKKNWMDIYSKPTGLKQYLPFKFNHPKICFKNTLLLSEKNLHDCEKLQHQELRVVEKLRNLPISQKYPKNS